MVAPAPRPGLTVSARVSAKAHLPKLGNLFSSQSSAALLLFTTELEIALAHTSIGDVVLAALRAVVVILLLWQATQVIDVGAFRKSNQILRYLRVARVAI